MRLIAENNFSVKIIVICQLFQSPFEEYMLLYMVIYLVLGSFGFYADPSASRNGKLFIVDRFKFKFCNSKRFARSFAKPSDTDLFITLQVVFSIRRQSF